MPTVRYTSDGGSYRDNEGNRADPDDPVLDVGEEKAEVLVDEFRFEYVDDSDEPEPGDEDHPDADPEDLVTRNAEAVDDGKCGYYDRETMDSPCGRDAGWGRNDDDGPCKDHVDQED